jgi:hypothetical protein
MSSEVSSRRLFAAVMLLALAFTSLIQTGCTQPIRRLGIIDELAITYRDRVWAQRAFNLRYANCNREYADHFKSGFCAGYADVCNGGDGYLPALPPEQYRGYEYQCAEGSKCIDTWFDAYPAGVAAAREEKAGSYHEMHISRMIDQAVTQKNATNVLPSDVPVNQPSAKLLRPTTTVTAKRLGKTPVTPPRYAAVKSPLETVTAKAKQPSIVKPQSVLTKPVISSARKTASVPPIIRAPARKNPAPPIVVTKPASPPIVQASTSSKSSVTPPPIVRGRKIDPSANVSKNEIPLPMAVRSTFESRTAAWPVNRK